MAFLLDQKNGLDSKQNNLRSIAGILDRNLFRKIYNIET